MSTDGDDLGDGETLPPKKRKRQSKMSRRDIEEAMRAALDAKPETVVLVDEEGRPTKRPRKAGDDSGVRNVLFKCLSILRPKRHFVKK